MPWRRCLTPRQGRSMWSMTPGGLSFATGRCASGQVFGWQTWWGIESTTIRGPIEESRRVLPRGSAHHPRHWRAGMRLVMAGIIQDTDYFNQYVKPHLKYPDIDYIGSVGPDRRDKLLGNAAALLHPINFSEPFGLSIVESMACGTPVVAFNRGSMPEIIQHGKNGFLVSDINEAVNAIKKLDQIDRHFCRRTVEERFTADIMVKNYLKVYDKILDYA